MFVAGRDLFNLRGTGEKKCRWEAAPSQTNLRWQGKELISPLAATRARPVQQVVICRRFGMGQMGEMS